MADLGLCNDALFDSAILHKMCFCSCFMCKNKSFCFSQELFIGKIMHCHIKTLSLLCHHPYRRPRWAEVGQTYT